MSGGKRLQNAVIARVEITQISDTRLPPSDCVRDLLMSDHNPYPRQTATNGVN
ncbi:hypothetical protein TIFTF001_038700 [Ficus carica]|uniref:Uncharacterized protein n=1 Tax=Ficus carica TaxID=3494 RepID=A0AA88E7R6_FICCA|nr:hypothetical protein TIFTF001_038700 [Ficus carica]